MLAVSVTIRQLSGATSGLALRCCELGDAHKPGEELLSACPIPCAFLQLSSGGVGRCGRLG